MLAIQPWRSVEEARVLKKQDISPAAVTQRMYTADILSDCVHQSTALITKQTSGRQYLTLSKPAIRIRFCAPLHLGWTKGAFLRATR
jgi:hypothetical protein